MINLKKFENLKNFEIKINSRKQQKLFLEDNLFQLKSNQNVNIKMDFNRYYSKFFDVIKFVCQNDFEKIEL